MITRAGFSHRFRIVCYGMLSTRGFGRQPACLLRFVESGEYVWAFSLSAMLWPEQVEINSRLRVQAPRPVERSWLPVRPVGRSLGGEGEPFGSIGRASVLFLG